jgi:hypothetical protein
MTKLDRIELAFRDFHTNNPHVYTRLVYMARKWKRTQGSKLGMQMLFETIRWEDGINTIDTERPNYKLNNNYAALYARLIMEQEPDLNGLFHIRERTRSLN